MAKRDFKGIWIAKEIWLNDSLTMQEKVFLAEIDSLDGEEGCFATNEHFAELFNISRVRVSEVINQLISKGLVESQIDKIGGNKRTMTTILNKSVVPYAEKVCDPIKDSFNTLLKESLTHNKEEKTIENKVKAFSVSLWKDKPQFEPIWSKYMDYRKREKKGAFKTIETEVSALDKLFKDTNGDMALAQETIETSIASGYTGLFPKSRTQSTHTPGKSKFVF